jgi:drug/metabolite transporter (DMT)-like permease
MSVRKILGIVLLAAGTLALVYHGFSYTSDKHTAHLGSLDFTLKEKKRLEIPVWAGVAAIAAGAALLVLPSRKHGAA